MKNRVKVRGNADDENFCASTAMNETRMGRKLAFIDSDTIEVHQCQPRETEDGELTCNCSMLFWCYLDCCNKSWRRVGFYNLDGKPKPASNAAGGGK